METDMARKAIWERDTALESAIEGQDSPPPPPSEAKDYIKLYLGEGYSAGVCYRGTGLPSTPTV
jgi:hypothetical protein